MFTRTVLSVATIMMAASVVSADTTTWQGKLLDSGVNADGIYDFQFSLWDSLTTGSQLGSTIAVDNISVVDGLVTVDLNFTDPAAFDGNDRWIQVAVKADADGSYTTLAPRHTVNPTPYAMHALNVSPSAVPFVYNGANAVFTGGNVGIGTTTPSTALTIDTSPTTPRPGIYMLGDGINNGIRLRNTAGGGGDYAIYTDDTNQLRFRDYAAGNDRIVIDNTGNVGIGTTSPATRLHVVGDTTLGSSLVLDNVAQSDRWSIFVASANRLAFRDVDAGMTHMLIDAAGNVGIGTTTPSSALQVDAGGSTFGDFAIHGRLTEATAAPATAAVRGEHQATNNLGYGVWGSHAGSGSGIFGSSESGNGVKADSISGFSGYFTGPKMYIGGDLGLGTTAPKTRLDIRRNDGGGDINVATAAIDAATDILIASQDSIIDVVSNDSGSTGSVVSLKEVDFLGNLVDNWGMVRRTSANGSNLGFTFGNSTSSSGNPEFMVLTPNGRVGIGTSIPANMFSVAGAADFSGNVGIGTTTPQSSLAVAGAIPTTPTERGVHMGLIANANAVLELVAQDNTLAWIDFKTESQGDYGARLQYFPISDTLHAAGIDKFSVPKLEIRAGADIVEGFDSSDDEPVEPGTVMVIDPANPGALTISNEPYDGKVAGVVSGANGVDAGIHLGQESVLDGDTLVAMTGRVYVKCTMENGAIQPGDRLTTSSLAGHAMKATDRDRCDGAVIGKAMTTLDAETDLVLVLVNLQ